MGNPGVNDGNKEEDVKGKTLVLSLGLLASLMLFPHLVWAGTPDGPKTLVSRTKELVRTEVAAKKENRTIEQQTKKAFPLVRKMLDQERTVTWKTPVFKVTESYKQTRYRLEARIRPVPKQRKITKVRQEGATEIPYEVIEMYVDYETYYDEVPYVDRTMYIYQEKGAPSAVRGKWSTIRTWDQSIGTEPSSKSIQ